MPMMSHGVDGILLLDKPTGMSSNHALQRVKRLCQAKKAGHTGSLDPLASGLLPICLGEATKFSQFLLDSEKYYQTTAKLGIKTTTGDAEGDILSQRPAEQITLAQIEAVLPHFRGIIEQVPPMYSALKQAGRPLYQLARQGISVERPPRTLTISQLTLLSFEGDELTLAVRCSKGTYIRSLVEDIGEMLGCGAHVKVLRRLGVGGFTAEQMVPLDDIIVPAVWERLLPIEAAVTMLPKISLTPLQAQRLWEGKTVIDLVATQGCASLFVENRFMGVGDYQPDGVLVSRRLLTPPKDPM